MKVEFTVKGGVESNDNPEVFANTKMTIMQSDNLYAVIIKPENGKSIAINTKDFMEISRLIYKLPEMDDRPRGAMVPRLAQAG